MPYNIRKNWIAAFSLIVTKPIVLLPFMIIAFCEGLTLELIYFFPIKPISFIANPIIRKFFGEPFLHYPHNLILLPRLFYYAQIIIYVLLGVFLASISVNIVKNIKMGIALELKALIKNAGKRYLSFAAFALIMTILSILMKRLGVLVFSQLPAPGLAFILFVSNILMHTFLILTVPLIVIKEKRLFAALAGSIALGWRNFLNIFALIFLPFLIYLPIALLKASPVKLIEEMSPEINLYIAAVGILLAMVLNGFVYVCVAQFLMDGKVVDRLKR